SEEEYVKSGYKKIADYFGCSVDYLLGRNMSDAKEYTPYVTELYYSLSAKSRERALEYMRLLKEHEEKKQ
ncbi:MAG: hypothetical protein ACI4TH_00170, partial [Candidatus Ornithomonoglobus sp.]